MLLANVIKAERICLLCISECSIQNTKSPNINPEE